MKVKLSNGTEAEVDILFSDFCKTNDQAVVLRKNTPIPDWPGATILPATNEDSENPIDPTRGLIEKATLGRTSSAMPHGELLEKVFGNADLRIIDFRDSGITTAEGVQIRKSAPTDADWSWSTTISSSDAPLSKRGTARAKFEIELARLFAGHPEELSEARSIVDEALADERRAIELEAA